MLGGRTLAVLNIVDIALQTVNGIYFWAHHPHAIFDPQTGDIYDSDYHKWYGGVYGNELTGDELYGRHGA